jgi:copper(I)-binding protein
MTHPLHRRHVLRAAFAGGLVSCLPRARACEFFGANLRITHPWTRATAAGASTAIVSMKFDEVTQADRLIGIETPVAAGAEMGGLQIDGKELSFALAAGQNYELSETGSFVRLLGLKHPLALGRSYPLTLVFEHSGRIAAELSVDYAS